MFLNSKLCKLKHGRLYTAFLSLGLLCSSIGSVPLPAHAAGTSYVENIYHAHTGDTVNGGGCYTRPVLHQHSESCYRTYDCSWKLKTYYNKWDEINDYTLVFVSDCGETHEQQGDIGDKCSLTDHGSHVVLECTRGEETDHYDLACGMDSSTLTGSFAVVKSTDDWVQSLVLFMAHSGLVNVESDAYTVNGQPISDDNYTVSSNGTYEISLNCDDNSQVSTITVPVTNVDCTAPTLECTLSTQEWTRDNITVNATAPDLQPDGTAGCGNVLYSYDGGASWCDNSTNAYSHNGEYTVFAKDRLGNTNQVDFNIYNIDREAPHISVDYDQTTNLASTQLTITADDIMSDGRPGCGLDREAYSFDSGNTWSDSNTIEIRENGLVQMSVRDALGNVARKSIYISNIDSTPPDFQVSLNPDGWTNQSVELSIQAEDINPDGSDGSGVDEDGYSYDGGSTWCNSSTMLLNQNAELSISVRDRAGNISTSPCLVDTIDMNAPVVSLCYALAPDSSEAFLKVVATDTESGLADTPYKWDCGSYSESDTYTVTENRWYTISVKDNAGNITVRGIDVEGIVPHAPVPVPKPEPVGEPEPEPETIPEPEAIPEPEPVIDNNPQPEPSGDDPQPVDSPHKKPVPVVSPAPQPDKPAPQTPKSPSEPAKPVVLPKPIVTPAVIQKTIEETPVDAPRVIDTSDLPPLQEDTGSDLLRVLVAILIALLLAGLILGLLFALSRMILIYCKLGHNKEKFVGIAFARKSKDAFEANISQSVINSCDTTDMRLRFTMAFIYLHHDKDVTIYLPSGHSYIVQPDVNVSISISGR